MWRHDLIILGYWFESTNVLYYNPTIRNTLIRYKCLNSFKHLANLLLCVYLAIFPIVAIIYAINKYEERQTSYLQLVRFYLCNPLSLFTRSSVYNGMIVNHIRNIPMSDLVGFMDKTYWDKLFQQNNVLTPTIVGRIINGTIVFHKQLDKSRSYIIKPIDGYQGRHIQLFIENEDYSKSTNNFIIQEHVSFDNVSVATHLRCITAYKDNKLSVCMIYLCINPNSEQISSNSVDGVWFIVKDDKMRAVDADEWIDVPVKKSVLEQCKVQTTKLHKTFIDRQIPLNSIAFDIIVHKDEPYFLEGNLFYGLIENDIDFINTYDNYIDSII